MTDWTHPRIANPDCCRDRWDEIADQARAAFSRRRDTYPQLVQAGQITADEARDDLEGWRAIAKDWRWIATGDGEPATRDTLTARIAALDTAIARWFSQLEQNGGKPTEAEREQIAMIAAMRWWAEREHAPTPRHHARFYASVGHHYRATNGLPSLGAMRAQQAETTEKTNSGRKAA